MDFILEKKGGIKDIFKKFKRKKPDEESVSVGKLIQEKKFEEALKLHETESIEENADYWYTRGFLEGNLNKIEAPIECYDKVISLEPSFVKAWYRKGQCLLKIGKFFEASLCFEKVLDIERENVKSKKKDLWSGPAVYSLMISYISEYNKLNSEKKDTLKIKESANLWTEKCFNFFKENNIISKDSKESEFLEKSIQKFDKLLDFLEPSIDVEHGKKGSKRFNISRRSKIIIGAAIAITAIILIIRLLVIQQPLFSEFF